MFGDSSDNIKVVLRVRPPNSREIEASAPECIFESPDNPDTEFFFGTQTENKPFNFDYIAQHNSTQEQIYNHVGKPLADFSLDGYNICLFAYGQTGTGKTHTMYGKIGDEEMEGLQTRILRQVFESINSNKESQIITYVHYFEIYNENILDLLGEHLVDDKKQIQIREDVKKGVYVENLACKYISDYQSAMQLLDQGNKQRHIAETKMNMESSRSHSIFQFIIQQKEIKNGITNFKDSKINFVDLAGSERQKSTHATGDRLKEATNINKSLSILGRVINQLVEKMNNKKKHLHIPYRDSKLTFLLKDSLGGNAKTVMIATITASDLAYQETLSTLKFAQRAKMIENRAEKNEESSGSLQLLQKEIKLLKKQIEKYKIKIEKYEEEKQNYEILNTETSENQEYLTTQEDEVINGLTQMGDIDLVQEIQKLKDLLAIKEHELNIGNIKYQELEFDFQHQVQKNKILEKQLEEMQHQLLRTSSINPNSVQQLDLVSSNSNNQQQEKLLSDNDIIISDQNLLQVPQQDDISNNNLQNMITSTIGGQQLESIKAENEFLHKKLETFYKLQDKFLNSSQLKQFDENQSQLRVKEEDPFLEIMRVNEKLDQKVKDLLDDNNDLKNELHKLNEDNDTLRQTIFYISSQLNQARADKNNNGNFSAVQQRKTFSLSSKNYNQSSLNEYQARNSGASQQSSAHKSSHYLDPTAEIVQGMSEEDDHAQKQNNQKYFQYYSNYKYQLLLQSNNEILKFYQDKNAIIHNDLTIYIFMVWQNEDGIQTFLKNFKHLAKKIQKQTRLIINFMGNGFNDDQFEQIISQGLRQFIGLKELNLNVSHNDISDYTVQGLADTIKFMPQLEKITINLQKNRGITPQMINYLLQKIKDLQYIQDIEILHEFSDKVNPKEVQQLSNIGDLKGLSGYKLQIKKHQEQHIPSMDELNSKGTMSKQISFVVKETPSKQEVQQQSKKKDKKKKKKHNDDYDDPSTCKACTIY